MAASMMAMLAIGLYIEAVSRKVALSSVKEFLWRHLCRGNKEVIVAPSW